MQTRIKQITLKNEKPKKHTYYMYASTTTQSKTVYTQLEKITYKKKSSRIEKKPK